MVLIATGVMVESNCSCLLVVQGDVALLERLLMLIAVATVAALPIVVVVFAGFDPWTERVLLEVVAVLVVDRVSGSVVATAFDEEDDELTCNVSMPLTASKAAVCLCLFVYLFLSLETGLLDELSLSRSHFLCDTLWFTHSIRFTSVFITFTTI